MNYKILHIAPHLGGGVGRVLLNYLEKTHYNINYNHYIYCLDTINDGAKAALLKNGISFDERMSCKQNALLELIALSDIVVIHWWNHPLLYEFLVKNELPASRVVMWSHVSGNEAPQIFTRALLDYPDYFIFTTPMSYQNREVVEYENDTQKLKDIWSTGGLEYVKDVKKKPHEGFNIGYLGTVDFSKMYLNFISMCSKIDIPDVKFIVCGSGHIELLKEQAKELGIWDKFEFTGHIDDVAKYLEIFDLFGYPLNSKHYGTCDQALAEAMGCGIVPVVFGNNMESYMVHNRYSGIVVHNEKEYIDAILELYNNKRFKDRLGKKAKEEAGRRFSIKNMIFEWEIVFKELLTKEKTSKKWSGKYRGYDVKPHEIFLESIGRYSKIFEDSVLEEIKKIQLTSPSWQSKTKGTIHHYNEFFNDEKLKLWSEISEKKSFN